MAIREYLAMTVAEIRCFGPVPEALAWLACHFSPYGQGLSNLPRQLPEGSLLILDDITPIHGHDPQVITRQLRECVEVLGCSGVLLDFQRPGYPEASALAQVLCQSLPCPVGVSHLYGRGLACPVFLPPLPCESTLSEALSPWTGREIWLDTGTESVLVTVTEQGSAWELLPYPPEDGFCDKDLHCHYLVQEEENSLKFLLWRTNEDRLSLLEEAQGVGIQTAIGLWQETL